MIAKSVASICTLVLVVVCLTRDAIGQQSIEGVWQVSQIERDHEGSANESPLPSLMIFTKSHYSIVWMPGSTAIEAFATRWEPTDKEKIQRFGEVVVNTGAYEIEGNKLKVTPVIARMPEFIGGLMVYEYEWTGSGLTLTLMEEYTFDGVPAPWTKEATGKIHVSLTRVDD